MSEPYRVIVAPEALVEVVQISAWWRKNRRPAPRLFQRELDEALLVIAAQPEIGTATRGTRVGNARVVNLQRSGYRVFYQVDAAARMVLVVHVRHGRRRPLKLRSR